MLGVVIGLQRAGQHQRLALAAGRGRDQRDRGDFRLVRSSFCRIAGLDQADDAADHQDRGHSAGRRSWPRA